MSNLEGIGDSRRGGAGVKVAHTTLKGGTEFDRRRKPWPLAKISTVAAVGENLGRQWFCQFSFAQGGRAAKRNPALPSTIPHYNSQDGTGIFASISAS